MPVDVSQAAWRPLGEGVVVEPGTSMPLRMVGRTGTACGSDAKPVDEGGSVGTDRFVDLSWTVLGLPREASPAAPWSVLFEGPLGCPAPVS
ncbi:hypothetical protein [Pseudokineococcus sp. 1T1Z-3]|uniref:hypothetical protein n=1 Tax=Pseudokineococcus sp. 1T1Z-3 TaxID=3132745 RepID=UPI0030B349A6